MVKKNRLGKGLSALLSSEIDDLDIKEESSGKNLVSINEISLSKFQARKKFNQEKLRELSESIEKNGLIQPIIIRKGKKNFELVAGERRLKACKLIGLKEISAIISNFDDRKAFESGLIENLQREDLTCIEEAEGYNRLMNEFNYTQEELASIVSKSRSHVANLLRLISLYISFSVAPGSQGFIVQFCRDSIIKFKFSLLVCPLSIIILLTNILY